MSREDVEWVEEVMMTHHRICSGRIGVLALNLRVQMTILSGICVVLRVSRGTVGGKPKRDMHRGHPIGNLFNVCN